MNLAEMEAMHSGIVLDAVNFEVGAISESQMCTDARGAEAGRPAILYIGPKPREIALADAPSLDRTCSHIVI